MNISASANLPPLATMGVGSYAPPGWMFPFRKAIRAGSAGSDDIDEAFADATRVVVAEQIEAGGAILSPLQSVSHTAVTYWANGTTIQ